MSPLFDKEVQVHVYKYKGLLMFRSIIKWLFWMSVMLSLLFAYIAFRAISNHPTVGKKHATPQQVKNAAQQYDYARKSIFGPQPIVKLTFSQKNVNDIMTAASHAIPYSNFSGRLSDGQGVLNASFNLSNQWKSGYLNVSCTLVSRRKDRSIKQCQIGKIFISGFIADKIMNIALNIFFDDKVKVTVNQLINNIQINKHRIVLIASKDFDFKDEVKSGLQSVASTMKKFKDSDIPIHDSVLINEYLHVILNTHWHKKTRLLSLSEVIIKAFEHAHNRSQYNKPAIENDAALWAIAIGFANHNFADIIDVNTPEVKKTLAQYPKTITTLNGRTDLSLHFLYSAIMESLGNSALSVQVGELKELYDTNPAGSGFDFTDLAADKAGATFSQFLTANETNARQAQNILRRQADETLYFPALQGLPKPIKGKEFDSVIGSTETDRYHRIVDIIQQRIDHLPLYQTNQSP